MAFNNFPLGILRKNQKYQRIQRILKMFVTNREKTFKKRLNILKCRMYLCIKSIIVKNAFLRITSVITVNKAINNDNASKV